MAPETTRVGLGFSEGYRCVAIEPPLTTEEIMAIEERELAHGGQVRQVADEPNCTLICFETTPADHREQTVYALQAARDVAKFLRPLRTSVAVDMRLMPLGTKNTPFSGATEITNA